MFNILSSSHLVYFYYVKQFQWIILDMCTVAVEAKWLCLLIVSSFIEVIVSFLHVFISTAFCTSSHWILVPSLCRHYSKRNAA